MIHRRDAGAQVGRCGLDLLKILRSFEEFIFEATTWLVFYPLTLWRIVRRPLDTMEYSDRQQSQPDDRRYDDALSPPLVLLVTVVIANLIAAAAHVPPPPGTSELTRALIASQQNLVLFRSLVFSLIPLVAAATLLRRQGQAMSRETLRAPFYAQCYLAAPSAAFVSAGGVIFQRPDISNLLGLAIICGGTLWFLIVQTRWFRSRLAVSWLNAAATTVWAMVRAMIYLVVILIPVALL